jgi:hypothetical protein
MSASLLYFKSQFADNEHIRQLGLFLFTYEKQNYPSTVDEVILPGGVI